jgi:oligosaccharyltransferase complex subunit beta
MANQSIQKYEIAISEHHYNGWYPFSPPANDSIQLEFSMLSPFHRIPLVPSGTSKTATTFSARLRTPDQHGIFNFFVEYRRPFFSVLEKKTTVTVRHFAHDEWPRSWSISAAWPWIAGNVVTIVGWLAFVAIWLYSKPKALEKVGGKTQ